MKRFHTALLALFAIIFITACASLPEPGKHLFILSGQSNMVGLDPETSFKPVLHQAFGEERIIVVKDAQSGRPIRQWYKKWQSPEDETPESTGELYDRLMENVHNAVQDENIKTVTFIWMQGERDARQGWGDVYAASLTGLIRQLETDLGREDIHVIIGRLSDFDMDNSDYPHWTVVRAAQMSVAESSPNVAWINTDDLNGPTDDLHYTAEGYEELGRRFAEKAIEMIR
jgi:hypothetical protein